MHDVGKVSRITLRQREHIIIKATLNRIDKKKRSTTMVDRLTKEKTRYVSSWQAACLPYWPGKAHYARPILKTR